MAATYWVGQDGNIYYGSGQEGAPVQNLGANGTGSSNYIARDDGIYDRWGDNGEVLQYKASRIADPMAPAPTTSAPRTGGSGTTTTAKPVLDQAAVDNTQRTINNLPALLADLLAEETQKYNNTMSDFAAQEKQQQGVYDTSSFTNQKNYDSNMMDSVRAGAKGLGGLMQILRGTGTEDWAREAVGSQTSRDIREGLDTRTENQTELDDSLGAFMTQLKGKRDENKDAYENNKRATRRDSNTQLQELYGKMAGYYGDAEMAPQRQDWMNKAGSLTNSIFQDSRSKVSNYDRTPVSVKAPEISAFADPTKKDIGYDGSRSQIGSGIFTVDERRKDREKNPAMGA